MNLLEKKNLRIELKSRKILKSKLDVAIRSLDKQVNKIILDRELRKNTVSEYKNEYDLHDAYGWGFITQDEYYSLLECMRLGIDAIDNEISAPEIAQNMLKGWLKIVLSDIYSIEYDLLPEKKKEKIRQENERILAEREKRRKEKGII